MKKNIIILFITALIFLGVFSPLALYRGYLRFNYPSYSEFPIQGIDVSNHQNNIKWKDINRKQIQFVFIKATEGGIFKDKKFKYNWDEAKKYGISVGAYHFFTFCKSGKEQSKNFIETVPNEENTLPPVIDLEYGGNCKNTKSREDIIHEIDTLVHNLFNEYKKTPILYVTEEFYNDYLVGKYTENPIWFRDIYKRSKIKDNRKWLFWQYGNRGHVTGIETYVDLNVFNGTKEEFEVLIK